MAPSGPPVALAAAGETLHRVHVAGNAARFYGRRDATWRWDDPARAYGVLYLGHTEVGPFAETLLRRPHQRALIWSEVARRRLATFRTTEPLRLADLHGAGLGWFGVTAADVVGDHDGVTYPGAYADCQSISAMVHQDSDLDGIQYRSRFDTDHLCVALFDRADHKLVLVDEGLAIDRHWVETIIEPRGRHIVDL